MSSSEWTTIFAPPAATGVALGSLQGACRFGRTPPAPFPEGLRSKGGGEERPSYTARAAPAARVRASFHSVLVAPPAALEFIEAAFILHFVATAARGSARRSPGPQEGVRCRCGASSASFASWAWRGTAAAAAAAACRAAGTWQRLFFGAARRSVRAS